MTKMNHQVQKLFTWDSRKTAQEFFLRMSEAHHGIPSHHEIHNHT